MAFWLRLNLALLALSVIGCAQNTSIIRQPIVNATATANYSIGNIGQVQHFVFATVTQSGGTCNTGTTFYLQGSTDNATWNAIAPPVSLTYTGGITQGSMNASGLYPYLRLRVSYGGVVPACVVNAWYVGTVIPFSNPQAILNTSNYLTQTLSVPVTAGLTSFTALTNQAPGTTAKPVIYGVVAGVSDAANAYSLVIQGMDSTCTTPSGFRLTLYFAGTSVRNTVLATSIVPYAIGNASTYICIGAQSAAGVTTPEVTVTYRYEGGS